VYISCRECLTGVVEHAEDAEVKCPFRDVTYACDAAMQDREIKAVNKIPPRMLLY
jgi:RanBP-type and C3HC4-type zinc finger-containing protein 1